MLLQPSPSIHTAFMRFPIDVIFLDRNLRVIKLVDHLPPWHTASAMEGRSCLELSAGEIVRRHVEVGDQLLTVEPSLAADGSAPTSADATAEADGEAQLSPDRPGDPTKVLLVGTDRRFRSVAATLLRRRGCEVSVSERIVGVAELAHREAVDVVVLDAGSLPTAATLAAVELDALEPPVGVVLVSAEERTGVTLTPVLEKWGEFDALFGAIAQARGARKRAGFSNEPT